MTRICVSKLTIIGSDNGLSPGRRQAIIWINAGILLIGPLVTNFNEIFIEIHTFSFKKIHLKWSSGKRRPFCVGLNVLTPFYSSPSRAVYGGGPRWFRYWMVCHLFGSKPLSKLMVTYKSHHGRNLLISIYEIALQIIVCDFAATLTKRRWGLYRVTFYLPFCARRISPQCVS